MKKLTSKKVLATVMTAVVLLVLALPVAAQINNDNLNNFRENVGLGDVGLIELIGNIVKVVMGFLGVVAVLIILYGGFIWMTAMGDPGKVDKAKKLIYAGVIGLVVIFAAFAIASFVLSSLGTATNANP